MIKEKNKHAVAMGKKGGKARWAKMTKEQRIAYFTKIGKKGAENRKRNKKGQFLTK